MPILKNAQKALRASKRKAVVNRKVKSQVKTAVATFKSDPSMKTLSVAFSRVDKAAKHNIFHKNKAARMKSSLSKQLVSTAK